ncbi:hypothetical protein KEM55_003891, partial [Ascosphaera atra]
MQQDIDEGDEEEEQPQEDEEEKVTEQAAVSKEDDNEEEEAVEEEVKEEKEEEQQTAPEDYTQNEAEGEQDEAEHQPQAEAGEETEQPPTAVEPVEQEPQAETRAEETQKEPPATGEAEDDGSESEEEGPFTYRDGKERDLIRTAQTEIALMKRIDHDDEKYTALLNDLTACAATVLSKVQNGAKEKSVSKAKRGLEKSLRKLLKYQKKALGGKTVAEIIAYRASKEQREKGNESEDENEDEDIEMGDDETQDHDAQEENTDDVMLDAPDYSQAVEAARTLSPSHGRDEQKHVSEVDAETESQRSYEPEQAAQEQEKTGPDVIEENDESESESGGEADNVAGETDFQALSTTQTSFKSAQETASREASPELADGPTSKEQERGGQPESLGAPHQNDVETESESSEEEEEEEEEGEEVEKGAAARKASPDLANGQEIPEQGQERDDQSDGQRDSDESSSESESEHESEQEEENEDEHEQQAAHGKGSPELANGQSSPAAEARENGGEKQLQDTDESGSGSDSESESDQEEDEEAEERQPAKQTSSQQAAHASTIAYPDLSNLRGSSNSPPQLPKTIQQHDSDNEDSSSESESEAGSEVAPQPDFTPKKQSGSNLSVHQNEWKPTSSSPAIRLTSSPLKQQPSSELGAPQPLSDDEQQPSQNRYETPERKERNEDVPQQSSSSESESESESESGSESEQEDKKKQEVNQTPAGKSYFSRGLASISSKIMPLFSSPAKPQRPEPTIAKAEPKGEENKRGQESDDESDAAPTQSQQKPMT